MKLKIYEDEKDESAVDVYVTLHRDGLGALYVGTVNPHTGEMDSCGRIAAIDDRGSVHGMGGIVASGLNNPSVDYIGLSNYNGDPLVTDKRINFIVYDPEKHARDKEEKEVTLRLFYDHFGGDVESDIDLCTVDENGEKEMILVTVSGEDGDIYTHFHNLDRML